MRELGQPEIHSLNPRNLSLVSKFGIHGSNLTVGLAFRFFGLESPDEFTDSDDLNGLSNSDGGSPSSHFDSDAEGSSMAPSFAGLTARQRAAQGDQSMAESLLVLPPGKHVLILV